MNPEEFLAKGLWEAYATPDQDRLPTSDLVEHSDGDGAW